VLIDWEVVPPAPCSTRRTGRSPMPRPLSSRLHIRRHHASERLQHRPFQPALRGAKACWNRGFHESRFRIHARQSPFRMEISHSSMDNSHSEWRFPFHARTVPILDGDSCPFRMDMNGVRSTWLQLTETLGANTGSQNKRRCDRVPLVGGNAVPQRYWICSRSSLAKRRDQISNGVTTEAGTLLRTLCGLIVQTL
jgi:hypothetical protein